MLTMQDALRILTEFWTKHGCMTVQPFNTEVGAGTMNPATVLRVLGPEPWRVAYPEPSVRPDDSRYGENPNRLQMFTQYQVILKPDPGNSQELFLASLEALGIDLAAHDVRFVEDNWAQPAIGAWGLGWEVWLDGMEITQFTYFQQVGGVNLDPVSVEITYGLERILMAMQGVSHFKDISYAPGISYGEAFGQSEYEMSRYYLDDADVDANRRLYETYVAEAGRLVDLRLPVPAHSYVLKSSHAFNVLDARGAISTTERAQAFSTMRRLARDISKLWIERREELGHPLGETPATPTTYLVPKVDHLPAGDLGAQPQQVAFEIGFEELPPHVVTETIAAVEKSLKTALQGTRLEHGPVRVNGTPRRVVVTIDDVHPREPDATRVVKGPKWQAAFDADGNPSRALQGFLRGQGADVNQVTKETVSGTECACLVVPDTGRCATDILAQVFSDTVAGLRADKNMKWSDPALTFSRAIRWIVALYGEHVIDVKASDVPVGRVTYVHRGDANPLRELIAATDLAAEHIRAGLVVDEGLRRDTVVAEAGRLAREVSGTVDIDAESALVDEITNLVEEPIAIRGTFDAKYLTVPEEILTTVMRKHQRYLPVRDANGALMPYFITFANGACDPEVVARGNAAVLRARYDDASFFWDADRKTQPIEFRNRLGTLTFETTLGSMAQRADRIAAVAQELGERIGVAGEELATLTRAAELAKFDLATEMVTELTSLAGYMASEYAREAGETAAVAQALAEMEQPRTTTSALPQSLPGAILAVADRADLLMAMFAIGAKPTGSSDPYALRRSALGLARLLRERAELAELDITDVLQAAAQRIRAQGIDVSGEAISAAAEFIVGRFGQLLRDEGNPAELVEVVQPTMARPYTVAHTIDEVQKALGDSNFREVVAAIVRAQRILPEGTPASFDRSVLTEPAEVALCDVVQGLPEHGGSLTTYAGHASQLSPAMNTFFDDILVMAEDPAVKAARLGLLATIVNGAPAQVDWRALDRYVGAQSVAANH